MCKFVQEIISSKDINVISGNIEKYILVILGRYTALLTAL